MASNPWTTSAAGFTKPGKVNGELNDYELRRFLQQCVAGVTGIDGKLVFPRWQDEPPDQPQASLTWCAIGETGRTRDRFAAVIHQTNPNNFDDSWDLVNRNEILEILASFYGPEADEVSELFAMGLSLEQNRYQFQLNGYGLVEVGDSVAAPEFIKERWVRRIDIPFRIRRQQGYAYKVLNLKSAQAMLMTDQSKSGYGIGGFQKIPYGSGLTQSLQITADATHK